MYIYIYIYDYLYTTYIYDYMHRRVHRAALTRRADASLRDKYNNDDNNNNDNVIMTIIIMLHKHVLFDFEASSLVDAFGLSKLL